MDDYIFENHGSLWLVRSTSADALQHLPDDVAEDAQWLGGALAVEPRYVVSLAARLQDDGFQVTR